MAADEALQFHLAGVGVGQIAVRLNIAEADVPAVIAAQLAARHPADADGAVVEVERMLALWRTAYTQGIAGDLDATRLALQISQHLTELRSHAPRQAPPVNPGVGIRTAWTTLATGAADAAASLLEIARSGRSETARIAAAAALLSRVGITEKVEVAASVRMYATSLDDTPAAEPQSAGDMIRRRLAMLAERERQLAPLEELPWPGVDPEVVDAEQ